MESRGTAPRGGGRRRGTASRSGRSRPGDDDPEAHRSQGCHPARGQGDADRDPAGSGQATRWQGDRVPSRCRSRRPGHHELQGEGKAQHHADRPRRVHRDLYAGRAGCRDLLTFPERAARAGSLRPAHRGRTQLPEGRQEGGRDPRVASAGAGHARPPTRPARRWRCRSFARAAACSARPSSSSRPGRGAGSLCRSSPKNAAFTACACARERPPTARASSSSARARTAAPAASRCARSSAG